MSGPLKVIVTGANRGIGKAICEAILKSKQLSPVKLYACSRAGSDLGLKTDSQGSIIYHKLDISDHKSVQSLADRIDDDKESIDVLINNAGINLDREASLDISKKTLGVNYYSTLDMCQTIIPHIKPGGRIVNMSSIASMLRIYDEPIRQRFRTADSLQDLDKLAKDYLAAVGTNKEEASGFSTPARSYNVSKALLNGATRILAEQNSSIQINACCPGWIDTDMGVLIGKPSKTPEQGTIIPMRLAFGDIGDTTGKFWANSSVGSTEDGRVREV